MKLEDLSPDAVALMRSLINNPRAVDNSPALRELFEHRLAMGRAKVHATAAAGRLIAESQAALAKSTS